MTKSKYVTITLILMLALVSHVSAQVRMEFDSADVRDVLQILGEIGGFNVVLDRDVQGTVTLKLDDIDVNDAVELVVKVSGYSSKMMGNTLVVASEERLRRQFTVLVTRYFPVRHVDPSTLTPSLQLMLQPAEVTADVSGGGVIVRGTEEQLAQAASFIRERDVPRPLNLEFIDTSIVEILQALARAGGYTLIADPTIEGTLTFLYRGEDVAEAIELVASQAGVEYRLDGKRLVVQQPVAVPVVASLVPATVQETRLVRLRYITPEEATDAISTFRLNERIEVDELNGALVVTGTAQHLDEVDALIGEIDEPELSVHGVVVRDGARLVVLAIDGKSRVYSEGARAGDFLIESVSFDEVVLVDNSGERIAISGWKGVN